MTRADVAVQVEDVTVRFRVPHEPVSSFKEFVIRTVQRRMTFHDVSALHDVTFSVRAGESFGVIGPNGAGKSTLLRLIARVLRPTTGRVRVIGHIAPLLELGAGFHPELTGRENVYLNCALLGRRKDDVDHHLDEIIDFAEVGEFMDAPLRTFSAGMVARLGFSIATAWRPEILLVDELLSVGDEAFRRKCAERIGQFRQSGVTIFLVTHSLDLIEEHCQRALWLDHGRTQALGPARSVAQAYRASVAAGPAAFAGLAGTR